MKKVFLALMACTTLMSSVSFGRDTTVDSLLCYVKRNGQSTGEAVLGSQFFSKAARYSDNYNTCVIAKIWNEAETSRLYINGHRYGQRNSGMTNNEIKRELRSLGLRKSSCVTYSCVESLL